MMNAVTELKIMTGSNELTIGDYVFWCMPSLKEVYYYGSKEPKCNYETDCKHDCSDSFEGDGCGSGKFQCRPWRCGVDIEKFHLKKDIEEYDGDFCSEEAKIVNDIG